VSLFLQDFHQVVSEVSSCQVNSHDCVREGISFVDGDSVGDTITRVDDDTSGSS